jgi:uncharacterized protein (DUF2141 family)
VVLDIAPDNTVYTGGYFTSSSIGIGDTTFNLHGTQDMFLGRFSSELAATFSDIQRPSCNGSSDGRLVVKPAFGVTPYSYSWSHDGTMNSDTASNLSAGDYTVTVTDAVDSTVTLSHTLTEPDSITFNASVTQITTCYGDSTGAIDLSPAGGTPPYEYFWSTEDGGGLDATAEDQTELGAGTYNVLITDDNGCTADSSITITQPEDMSFSAVVDNLTNDDPEGSIDLTVSGATPEYSAYSWTGPGSYTADTEDISGLTVGGNYTVTVTDANSCEFDTTVNVIDSTQLDIFFHPDSIQNVSCNGGSDGRAVITVIQPANPPTFTWTGNPENPTNTDDSVAFNLTAGEYYVDVNDGDTTISDTVIITEPEPLNVTFTDNSTTTLDCNGDEDGIIDIAVTGGTPSYTYSWSNGATTEDLNNLPAGTYEVTVTDANGCTNTASYTINEPDALNVGISISSEITCYGLTNGELEANPTGGTPDYGYQWNDGASQTTKIADGLGPGSYQVTVTDANGCVATASESLTEPDSMSLDSYSSSDITCNGAGDGEIHLNVTGGTGSKSYNLNPGNLLNNYGDFNNLGPDVYTVTVTDDNGCPGPEITDTINEPDALNFDLIDHTDITGCNGESTGSISVDGSGGTGTLTYTLQPNGRNEPDGNFTGLTAGTYTVEMNDANGCGPISTGNITIDEPAAITIDDVTHSDVTCNNGTNGSITVTASGGTGNLSYTLQPVNITNNTGQFDDVLAGTYTVDVNDENDCGPVSTDNIVINEPSAISIDGTSSSNITCNGAADGSITVNASGGTGTLTYTLQPDGTSNTTGEFTNLTAGSYTVDVTDENGCGPETTSQIDITEPAAITITDTSHTDVTCAGNADGTITVTASGGSGNLSYTLQPDGVTNTTGEFNNLGPGTYSVDVTDDNGCGPVNTGDFTVTEPAALSIDNITSDNISCFGGSDGFISVTASGGSGTLSYTLQPDGITNETGDFSNLPAGTYTVEVNDGNLCGPVTSSDITLTEPTAINITNTTSNDASCNGCADGSITVTAEGGTGTLTYTLQPDGIVNTTGEFTNLEVGTYTVDVTDDNNCGPISTGDIGIGEPSQVTINSSTAEDVSCNGSSDGTITVTASGGNPPLIYTLQPDGTTNETGEFADLAPGTYTVDVTDQGGYGPISTGDLTINEPAQLSITGATGSNVTCNGADNGSISVTAEGGTGILTYTLNPGGGSNNTGNFTGLSAGTYTVDVTDENGCGPVTTSSINITEPPAISITDITSSDITCNGANNGSITVTAEGGTGSLTYTLQPNGTTSTTGDFTGLSAGTYTVEVTDAEGCGPVETSDISITEPAALSIGSSSSSNVTCSGGSDGTITLSASGGTGTLTYTLQPDGTSNTTGEFTGLTAGTYTVDITDDNGCGPLTSSEFTITEPNPVSITSTSVLDVTCNGAGDGSIAVSASGGRGDLSYTLQPDGTTSTTGEFAGLTAGTYTVEITDANGCGPVTTEDLVVEEPPAITIASEATTDVTCHGGSDGSVTVSAEGGTAPLTYVLQPLGMTNETGAFTDLPAGDYTVEITDGNSCGPVTTNLSVTEPQPLTFTSTDVTDVTNCASATNGAISVRASGGSGSYTYTLLPDGTSNSTGDFNNLGTGNYTVEVTDANGCGPIQTDITLTGPPAIEITRVSVTNIISCAGDASGSIDVQATGGTGNLTYTLQPDGLSGIIGEFTELTAGNYTVEVTDENGCGPVDTAVTITEPDPVTINSVTSTDVTGCHGDSTGSITVNAEGGTGSLNYTLLPDGPSNATGEFTNLPAGNYTVEVTDIYNCGPAISGEITLEEPQPLSITNIEVTDATDESTADGSITVTAEGGTPPLSYVLNPDSIAVNETGEFTGLSEGVYSVMVSDVNGCGPVETDTINVAAGPNTLPDELGEKYQLSVYPNPSSGKVNIDMTLEERTEIQVHFLNTLGQVQNIIRFEADNQKVHKEIHLDPYRGGVYIMKFFSQDRYLGKRLLIINK